MRTDVLQNVLEELKSSSADVEASALISSDGLMIASALQQGVDEDRVGAMSAALLSLGDRAARELARGTLESVRLSFLLMAAHPLLSLIVLLFVVIAIVLILIVPFLIFLMPAFTTWLSSTTIEQVFLKHMSEEDRERTLMETDTKR